MNSFIAVMMFSLRLFFWITRKALRVALFFIRIPLIMLAVTVDCMGPNLLTMNATLDETEGEI